MYDIRKFNFFFLLFEFFISCIFHPNYYTDYFFSFIGITLSIISLIFSLLKDSTSSISNTSKVRSSYFFVVIKCNFSLAQKSTKKFTTIPNYYDLFCTKRKCIMRGSCEKNQSISLNYLIYYSDPKK